MVTQKAVRWPCGVCRRGTGNNSIQCTSCQKWVHRKCSGIKGSLHITSADLFFLYSFHASVDFFPISILFLLFPSCFSNFLIPPLVSLWLYWHFVSPHVPCAVSVIIFFICCQYSFTSRYFYSASTTLSLTNALLHLCANCRCSESLYGCKFHVVSITMMSLCASECVSRQSLPSWSLLI